MSTGIGVVRALADEQVAEMIRDFYNDTLGFAIHILKMKPSDQQAEILTAFDHHDHISSKSGHGTGKSSSLAAIGLKQMSTRYMCRVICTAPSKHQLHDVLWSEISKWHRQMNPVFALMFEWTKEKFFHKDHPEEWMWLARTANRDNPEAMQGIHGDYVTKLIEEASGVPDEIFEVLEGATGIYETKEVLMGNPTRLSGQFYDSHNKLKKFYKRFTLSCLDSPFPQKGYAERIAMKYGKDSNMFRVRVLGEFPFRDGDSFIPFDLVDDARYRDIDYNPKSKAPRAYGVDVAKFGDDETAIAKRHGDMFFPIHTLSQKNNMEVAGYVTRMYYDDKEKGMAPQAIFVDAIGIGSGVADRLEETLTREPVRIVPVNVAEAPAFERGKYKKLRDELWGRSRDWFEKRRGRISDNEEGDLLAELTTPRYKILSDGKILIESKQAMRKRGVKSPNSADAFNMTFLEPDGYYTNEKPEMDFCGEEGYYAFDQEAGY